ncbi:MAG TPA: ABC transporter ATP-binding protein [Candidatus Coproplasma excrementipullorum]|nr:ABC transporter ATP-binding protein [Candidatus Coproplasma excrementipullorum]
MIRRFIPYYRPHIKLFIADILCAALISAFNLIYPNITREIIDNYVPNGLLNWLLVSAIALLIFYIVKAGLNYFLQYWGHIVGVRIQKTLRSELFDHLERMPLSFFDENKTGVLMSRLTNDLFEISELAHHGPEDVLLSAATLIGAIAIMFTYNVWLALILLALVPLILIYTILMRKKFVSVYDEMRVVQGEINADVESAVSGIRVARAYTAEAHEKMKFERGNDAFANCKGKQYKVMGQYYSTMRFLLDFMNFVVIIVGGIFFFNGQIEAGVFSAFIMYVTTFSNPIVTLTTIYEQIQQGLTGFNRFCNIMDKPVEAEDENAVNCGRLKGDICFDNVSFSYKSDESANKVISGFTCSIKAGRTVALVGPSGGGKTTLCHLIPRFYEIDEGAITIDGTDIRKMTRQSLRANIGIVQQDVFLFNGTIRENIAYGDFEATDEQITEAAKRANIHDYVMSLPDGYDTNVGERGVKLSGGQKQRISIARAFLKNPPILILDEATSALDNATEMLIQDALNELSEGRTTIVVAHRLSTVKNADEIIVVTPGGIAERGTHEELMALGGIYKGLYEYQFKNL